MRPRDVFYYFLMTVILAVADACVFVSLACQKIALRTYQAWGDK